MFFVVYRVSHAFYRYSPTRIFAVYGRYWHWHYRSVTGIIVQAVNISNETPEPTQGLQCFRTVQRQRQLGRLPYRDQVTVGQLGAERAF